MTTAGVDAALWLSGGITNPELGVYFAFSALICATTDWLRNSPFRASISAALIRVALGCVAARAKLLGAVCILVWAIGWKYDEYLALKVPPHYRQNAVAALPGLLLAGAVVPLLLSGGASARAAFAMLLLACVREFYGQMLQPNEKLPPSFPDHLTRYLSASVVVGALEMGVGTACNSLALEGDAWHMLLDAAALGLGRVFPGKEMHAKVKFTQYVLLLLAAGNLVVRSATRVAFGVEALRTGPVLGVAMLGLFLNLEGMYTLGTKLCAVWWHLAADFAGSLIALCAASAIALDARLWFFDPIAASLVAAVLFIIGARKLRKNLYRGSSALA